MKTVEIKIQGTSPILLHSPAGMVRQSVGKKRIPTPEEEAATSRYLMPDGETLAFPTYNFVQSLLKATSGMKIGKKSVVPYFAGCVTPAEELASFGTKEYKIDTRRAIVQRQGILRSRAKVTDWTLTFKLMVDIDNFPDGFAVKDLEGIVEEAGLRVGIGDFRPACRGSFGRFQLASLKVL